MVLLECSTRLTNEILLPGTSDKIEQQLATFGITNVQVVITHSGEKKTDKHREYLKTVKAIEEAKSVTPDKLMMLVPSSTDILLGSGKPIQNHPGVRSSKHCSVYCEARFPTSFSMVLYFFRMLNLA